MDLLVTPGSHDRPSDSLVNLSRDKVSKPLFRGENRSLPAQDATVSAMDALATCCPSGLGTRPLHKSSGKAIRSNHIAPA